MCVEGRGLRGWHELCMCRPLCVVCVCVCAHMCSAGWEDVRYPRPLAQRLGLCQHSHWFGLLKFAGEGVTKYKMQITDGLCGFLGNLKTQWGRAEWEPERGGD